MKTRENLCSLGPVLPLHSATHFHYFILSLAQSSPNRSASMTTASSAVWRFLFSARAVGFWQLMSWHFSQKWCHPCAPCASVLPTLPPISYTHFSFRHPPSRVSEYVHGLRHLNQSLGTILRSPWSALAWESCGGISGPFFAYVYSWFHLFFALSWPSGRLLLLYKWRSSASCLKRATL